MASETPERSGERKRRSARYGHIKRKLKHREPLEGELLELAVEAAGGNIDLAEKLRAGRVLGEYVRHLMFDICLLHARLSAYLATG